MTLGPFHFTKIQLVLVILAIAVFVVLDLFLRLTKLDWPCGRQQSIPDLARASGIRQTESSRQHG